MTQERRWLPPPPHHLHFGILGKLIISLPKRNFAESLHMPGVLISMTIYQLQSYPTRFNQINEISRITKITRITRFTRSTKLNRTTKFTSTT